VEFSQTVQNRNLEAFTVTIKQQMFSILCFTTDKKVQEINAKRLIHFEYWTEQEVSIRNLIFI